jgi:hypothetical protein
MHNSEYQFVDGSEHYRTIYRENHNCPIIRAFLSRKQYGKIVTTWKHFYTTNNEQTEKEYMKIIPFTIASKN